MTCEIFAVHGVNTPPTAPFEKDWATLLGQAGIAAKITAGRWVTENGIAHGIAKVLTNAAFRSIAVAGSPTIWNPFAEHDYEDYLGSPVVQKVIASYT